MKDDPAANAAFEKLQADYGGHAAFRQAVLTIGDNLRWRNIDAQAARQMYTVAASGEVYPDMIWARMGLAISCVRLKDFDAAATLAESIPADFAGDDRIGQALCHIGDAYRDQRKHAEAQRIYRYVVDHLPRNEYAMWSQVGLAVSAIDSRDEAAAQAAIEKLGKNHAARQDFPAALCVVADNCRWRDAHARARDLYALAAHAGPNYRNGIWFQMGLAISAIASGDPNTAQAALAKLHSQYKGDPALPQALYEAAYAFSNGGRFDTATREFNHVIATWPDSDYTLRAKVGLGLIQVRQGHDVAAEKIYEQILSDYEGHPKLAEATYLMAQGYFELGFALEENGTRPTSPPENGATAQEQGRPDSAKQYYQRAIAKWQIIIEKFPESPQAPEAWYFTGVIYRRHLGDVEKALASYEKVAATWPEYKYAWSAQGMIAQCYEKLRDTDKIAPAQADPKIERAYRATVENYADSPLAPRAYLRLGHINTQREQWNEAAKYYTAFLERYPQAKEWANALVYLGLTYERRGQTRTAAELYRSYLGISNPSDHRVKMVQSKLETMEKKGGQAQ